MCLASKFSAPKITDFNTLSDLDGHYQIEKALKLVCINYGIIGAFQIREETAAYKPYKAAHTAQDGTAVPEQAEIAPVYSSRDMFKLDEKFTEDQIKESCKICNTHWDDHYHLINALALELILNNCHPDMFRKITIQLNAVDENQLSTLPTMSSLQQELGI